jgi:hypothetical protein
MKKKKNKIVLKEQTKEETPSIESADIFEIEEFTGSEAIKLLKKESADYTTTRRISDLDTFEFEGDYHRFEKKKEFVFAAFYTGQILKEESREKAMWMLGINSLYLNKRWNMEDLILVLTYENEAHCEPALPEDKITALAEDIYELKKKEEIENRVIKTERRFIFKKGLTMEEKRSIIGKNTGPLVANARKESTLLEINEAIKNWDKSKGKITQSKISEEIKKNIKTVKRHWANVKDMVQEKNKSFNKKEINEDTKFFNGPHTGSTASEVVKVDPLYIKELETKGKEVSQSLKDIIEGDVKEVPCDFEFSSEGNPITKRTAKESIEYYGKENIMTVPFEVWENLQ